MKNLGFAVFSVPFHFAGFAFVGVAPETSRRANVASCAAPEGNGQVDVA